jgi:hypothetical protein
LKEATMTKLTWIALTAVAVTAACGGHHAAGTTPRGSNSQVITADEMSRTNATNLYEVVDRLRPRWFRSLRASAMVGAQVNEIVVYLDRSRMGGPEVLRQIQLAGVQLVRFYTPSEAEGEFGLGHMNGAIQVVMETRRP